MAIDTHIYRVCRRLGLIGPKVTVDKAHDLLEAAVEPEQVYPFHVAFISHGRQVCKAQRPRCLECIVGFGCPSREGFLALTGHEASDSLAQSGERLGPLQQLPHSVPVEDNKQ
jgi:endonuclease-3